MADDSLDVQTSLAFSCRARPYGIKPYIFDDLTASQKERINARKREQIREDQQYLAEHPEIRGIIAMIIRTLMRTRPKYDIPEAIGRYFLKPTEDIKEEVYQYIRQKKGITPADTSFSTEEDSESHASQEADNFEDLKPVEERLEPIWTHEHEVRKFSKEEAAEEICKEILGNILEKIFDEDEASMGSIESLGFPVDYLDHDVASHSTLSND